MARLAVLGGSSLVGEIVTTLCNVEVVAVPRSWAASRAEDSIPHLPIWLSLAPIWVLPNYFAAMQAAGVRRLVALSSTSRFSKLNSPATSERGLAQKLIEAETCLEEWAAANGIDWVILRPTLIYGAGRDKNVSEIARFIRRWRVFPLVGGGTGLRQPLHAQDVAAFCLHAAATTDVRNVALDIAGGETLSYRDMVERVFEALGRKPIFIPIPALVLRFAVAIAQLLPPFRGLSPALADRMSQDLVFDASTAARVLQVQPRPFVLRRQDIPS